MTGAHKIAWKDGMFLYPHHFQQQDIYYEGLLKNYHRMLPFYNWGIFKLDIEESYLKLNKLVIRQCTGIFSDGTVFSIPDKNEAPCMIEIPKDYSNKFVYIGLSIEDKYNLNYDGENSRYNRYYTAEEEYNDITSEVADKKFIAISKLNINLFLEEDCRASLTLIPVARIIDAGDGIFIDLDYIPPCLRVSASNVLQGYVAKILGLLSGYVSSNSGYFGEGNSSVKVNRAEGPVILQTAGRFKYLFELLLKDKMLTPYLLFEHIVSLIGSLSVFTKNFFSQSFDINYNHSNLLGSFEPLIKTVESIFKQLNEYVAVQITFKREENGIYTAKLDNALALNDSEIIIGIEQATEEKKEYDDTVKSLKIASIKEIERLISLQVSGIGFYTVNTLPSYVPYNNRTLYFKIKKEGNFWLQVVSNKDIALHLTHKPATPGSIKLWLIPPQLQGSK